MTYSYQVPPSYTVNVSLTATPTGLAGYNTNSIAIFSNETANFSENYIAALTPDTVKNAFGSDSLTYKMALALFTPAPNFRTGSGNLYVFRYNGTNATHGTLTTASLESNLTGFKSVADGELSITIDGTNTVLSGLNFTTIKTVADIVTVLKNRNLDVDIEAVGNTIKFTSRRYGTTSAVEISTVTGGGGTDLSASAYLNATAATEVTGTAATGSLSTAVSNALKEVYFGGVLTTQFQDDTTLEANASAIQAMDCVYYESIQSLIDIAVVGAANKTAGNGKTRLLAYSLGANDSKRAIATYATLAKSVNYNASGTANTLNLKTLTGILPDSNLSDTYILNANNNGVDVYGNTGGLACVYSNDNNGYTDDIENSLWLKKALEIAGFNYLRQTTTKIPQTEAGMTGLKNAYGLICEQAVRNGVCAPGTWNSAVPFGDPEDFKRNIEERGYYVYSIPISQQSQVDREARKAPVCQIAVKFSGAFHFSEVIVVIER